MRSRRSTLTPAEKEDREVARLSRPAPTKKPPRHDLRRDIVRDEDTEADRDPEDPDLSLNYKRVADTFDRWAAKVLQDKKPKEPGDYWQTDSGWGVFPKGSKHPTSAPDEESAKNLSQGQQGGPAEPAPAPRPKKPAPSPEERAQKLRNKIDKLLSSAAGADPAARKALEGVTQLEGREFKQAADALMARLGERKEALVSGAGSWAAEAADAAEAALEEPDARESPEDKGRRAAELLFADQVLTNPSNLGGVPLASTTPSDQELGERAEQSFRVFRDLTPKLREAALNRAAADLRTIGEEDPRRAELERVVDGLALACYLEGEDPVARAEASDKDDPYGFSGSAEVRVRPRMSESFGKLAKLLDQAGNAPSLLMGAQEFFGPRGRAAVSAALDEAADEDVRGFLEDTPFAEVGDALMDEHLGPAQRAVVRDAARRLSMEDMTTMQGVVAALQAADTGEKSKGSKKVDKKSKDVGAAARQAAAQDAEMSRAVRGAMRCLGGGAGRDECEQQVTKLVLAGLAAFDRALERLAKEEGLQVDPQDPNVAKVRHAVKTGDLSVLDQLVVAPDSLAALSGPKDREDTTKMAAQPTPISRTAANGIAFTLDKTANVVVAESDALGVPKKLAAQYAQIADQVADAIDRKAGIRRHAAQRTAADFNPEQIGEEQSGPLLDGTPEPYMKGEWSQQEFRELGDRQMSGELNKDKPIMEPRKPTPGAQMRPLAKSLRASVDKLAALAEMGKVSPERLAKAEKAIRLATEVIEDNG